MLKNEHLIDDNLPLFEQMQVLLKHNCNPPTILEAHGNSGIPRVDHPYLTIQKIIDVTSDDRRLMSPADSGNLGIELGDGITLSSSIGR